MIDSRTRGREPDQRQSAVAPDALIDRWLRLIWHELLRSPAPTQAERLVFCARELLPRDRAAATCVVGALLTELHGHGRYVEMLAAAAYDGLIDPGTWGQ